MLEIMSAVLGVERRLDTGHPGMCVEKVGLEREPLAGVRKRLCGGGARDSQRREQPF